VVSRRVRGGGLIREFLEERFVNWFYLGLDLGQRADYSAIAVVERVEAEWARFDYVQWLRRTGREEARFAVRHLERMALGTSYVAVAERVREMAGSTELRGRATVVVDGTGVGAAVVDLLRGPGIDCELVPVQITGGGRARQDGGAWNVPKRDLIGVVQVLLEQRRLKFAADLPRMQTLVEELMAMRVRVTEAGMEQFGAWREGSHDDLALALALGCWRAKGDERVVG
jgi:hypothetical protein